MTRLLIFVGMTVGSWIGWTVGERLEGLMTAVILSGVFGCAGVYAGWKAAQAWAE